MIRGYYELLGITQEDVKGENPASLWKIINKPDDVPDQLKHLADALELYAICRQEQGIPDPYARITSMKFYSMSGAPDSLVRVGQDLADEFVGRGDFEGAKQVMENNVLPIVISERLLGRLV